MNVIYALSCLATAVVVTDAKPEFVSRLPNGANVAGVDALGHKDSSGGGDLNAFGEAFDAAGRKWTTELCRADSDGDGQTNGEELGDPCCVWTSGGTPKFTAGASHPGDATKTVVASVLASNSCSSGSSSTTTTKTTTPTTTTSTPSATSASSVTTATPAPAATTSSAASIPPAIVLSVAAGVAAFSHW